MISRLRSLGPRGLPEAIGQCFCQVRPQRKTIIALADRRTLRLEGAVSGCISSFDHDEYWDGNQLRGN